MVEIFKLITESIWKVVAMMNSVEFMPGISWLTITLGMTVLAIFIGYWKTKSE
jgi:hypothetical protein